MYCLIFKFLAHIPHICAHAFVHGHLRPLEGVQISLHFHQLLLLQRVTCIPVASKILVAGVTVMEETYFRASSVVWEEKILYFLFRSVHSTSSCQLLSESPCELVSVEFLSLFPICCRQEQGTLVRSVTEIAQWCLLKGLILF